MTIDPIIVLAAVVCILPATALLIAASVLPALAERIEREQEAQS